MSARVLHIPGDYSCPAGSDYYWPSDEREEPSDDENPRRRRKSAGAEATESALLELQIKHLELQIKYRDLLKASAKTGAEDLDAAARRTSMTSASYENYA